MVEKQTGCTNPRTCYPPWRTHPAAMVSWTNDVFTELLPSSKENVYQLDWIFNARCIHEHYSFQWYFSFDELMFNWRSYWSLCFYRMSFPLITHSFTCYTLVYFWSNCKRWMLWNLSSNKNQIQIQVRHLQDQWRVKCNCPRTSGKYQRKTAWKSRRQG